MKTNQFNYDFGVKGEDIRQGLKIFGRTNIEYQHDDNRIHSIYIGTKIGAVPDYLQMDFGLDSKVGGIYSACEKDLADERGNEV